MILFHFKRNLNRKFPGFSLIEVILGVALFAVLMVTVSATLVNTFKASRRVDASSRVKNEGALVIDRIARDIEFSKTVSVCPAGGGADSLTLVRADDTQVVYLLNTTDKTIRLNGGIISSAQIAFDNYLPDCPKAFVCEGSYVKICVGAEAQDVLDVTDTASASGGLKFYRQVLRQNI